MAGLKEIKRRLRSVRNTSKITYAMKLVSTAKLRKVQESVVQARDYVASLVALLNQLNIQKGMADITHPLLEEREQKRRIVILVVGGQRGLCGPYNSSLNKRIESSLPEIMAGRTNLEIEWIVVGKKVAEYFRRVRRPYITSYETLSENVETWPIEEILHSAEAKFLNGTYDEAWLIYTEFQSAMTVTPKFERLLPLSPTLEEPKKEQELINGDEAEEAAITANVMKFEPSLREVFFEALPRILRTKLRQACFNAKASETASRVTAMDAATRNAAQLAKKLQLLHNKLRQQRITSELLDIIGGAEALK